MVKIPKPSVSFSHQSIKTTKIAATATEKLCPKTADSGAPFGLAAVGVLTGVDLVGAALVLDGLLLVRTPKVGSSDSEELVRVRELLFSDEVVVGLRSPASANWVHVGARLCKVTSSGSVIVAPARLGQPTSKQLYQGTVIFFKIKCSCK